MNANEKQNSTVLENRDYRNQNPNSVNENTAVSEDLYDMDEFKKERLDLVASNDYNPENPNPDQITNDDDFLDTDFPDDDEEDVEEEDPDDIDLEEEAEESINQPGEDFNEIEESIEDPEEEDDDYEDYQEDEEDFPEEDPGKF